MIAQQENADLNLKVSAPTTLIFTGNTNNLASSPTPVLGVYLHKVNLLQSPTSRFRLLIRLSYRSYLTLQFSMVKMTMVSHALLGMTSPNLPFRTQVVMKSPLIGLTIGRSQSKMESGL